MEWVADEIDGSEFGIGDFDAFGIPAFIQYGAHSKSGRGRCCRDQLNDGLETPHGLAAPVECNKGKEAVFDLVPFEGARRQTVMGTPSLLASACSSTFHRRTRCPLLPPPSAVIRRRLALGFYAETGSAR